MIDGFQMLRMMPEFAKSSSVLLPARGPNSSLPHPIIEFCAEQPAIICEEFYPNKMESTSKLITTTSRDTVTLTLKAKEVELTPVEQAVAMHLGINVSPEAQAQRNRRGIAIVVHGAPLSGKTALSRNLGEHYGAAVLSIDQVVSEAICQRVSAAGCQAWELCCNASMVSREKDEEQDKVALDGFACKTAVGSGSAFHAFLVLYLFL